MQESAKWYGKYWEECWCCFCVLQHSLRVSQTTNVVLGTSSAENVGGGVRWEGNDAGRCSREDLSAYSVTSNVLREAWFLEETKEGLKSNQTWEFLLSWCRAGLQLLSLISVAGQSAVFTEIQSREPLKNPPLSYFCSLLCGFFWQRRGKAYDFLLISTVIHTSKDDCPCFLNGLPFSC